MNEDFKSFGENAKGLSKNPLGIIALFIVLVYGFASLVTAFAGSFSATDPLHYGSVEQFFVHNSLCSQEDITRAA